MCLSVRQVFQLWYFYICFSRWPCVFFQHNNLKLQFFFVLSLWLFFCTGTQTRCFIAYEHILFHIFQINLFVWNCKSNLLFPEGCLTIKPCVQNVTNSLIVLLYSYAQKEELEITQSIELNKQQHLCPFLQRSSVFNQVDKPHRDHNEGTGKTFHISLIFTFQLHPEHFSLLFYCCLLCAFMTM